MDSFNLFSLDTMAMTASRNDEDHLSISTNISFSTDHDCFLTAAAYIETTGATVNTAWLKEIVTSWKVETCFRDHADSATCHFAFLCRASEDYEDVTRDQLDAVVGGTHHLACQDPARPYLEGEYPDSKGFCRLPSGVARPKTLVRSDTFDQYDETHEAVPDSSDNPVGWIRLNLGSVFD